MAVTEELLDNLQDQANRVLRRDEMIRRQEAMMLEDGDATAEVEDKLEWDEGDLDQEELHYLEYDEYEVPEVVGPVRAPSPRMREVGRAGSHPGHEPRRPRAGDSRRELIETLRRTDTKHRKITHLVLIGRCMGPVVVVALSRVMLGTDVRQIVIGLAIIAAVALAVVADSIVRRCGAEAHRKVNQFAWSVQRELNVRASMQDRRSAMAGER